MVGEVRHFIVTQHTIGDRSTTCSHLTCRLPLENQFKVQSALGPSLEEGILSVSLGWAEIFSLLAILAYFCHYSWSHYTF